MKNLGMVWLLCSACACAQSSPALQADGSSLTVTTSNAVAVFRGGDLVSLTNSATGESYLRPQSAVPLFGVDLVQATTETLGSRGWTVTTDNGTGRQAASIVFTDLLRILSMDITVDANTQEIVMRVAAKANRKGARAATWGIAGVDLTAGRLILPALGGSLVDLSGFPGDTMLDYPARWQSQMMLFEGAQGGFQVYSTDINALFKKLRLASGNGASTVSLSFTTDAAAPFAEATEVRTVEWRLSAFQGDWRTAAARYLSWARQTWPSVAADGNRAWARDIRTVVTVNSLDRAVPDALAARLNPSQTLLYITNWRKDPYDVNYPDYTPGPNAKVFVDRAHALGFRVMLHTDMVGVTPTNPDYQAVRQYQVKDPNNLAPAGWYWNHPVSDPQRFAFINPAASAYRKLFIDRVRPAIQALQADAIHLDVSGPVFEDGNGLIEGMNYAQGCVALHRDLLAAFPDLVLGGESIHELLAPYEWFAQRWSADQTGVELTAHPVAAYLLDGHVLVYGYLGQPQPEDPTFLSYFRQYERQGVAPTPFASSVSDLTADSPGMARLLALASAWQNHDLQPDWDHDWQGALFRYAGSDGSVATLQDSGAMISFQIDDRTLYRRGHGANRVTTGSFPRNWPAWDDQTLYGLDPEQEYWLEDIDRPQNTAHLTDIPEGLKLGPGTLVTTDFVRVDLDSAEKPAMNFERDLWRARVGITYKGAEEPLAYGATASIIQMAAGGQQRSTLFEHPPYQGGRNGGETFIEYTFIVPAAEGAALEFDTGINDTATRTDPVTFRVTVNGREAWKQDVRKGSWQSGRVDLANYAGQSIAVRFITNPGANGNTSFAWAGWSRIRVVTPPGTTSVKLVAPPAREGVSLSGLAVPGSTLVFPERPVTVRPGDSLLDYRLTAWLATATTLPVPGFVFGGGTIGGATSGGVFESRAVNAHPPNHGQTLLTWAVTLPDLSGLKLNFSAGIQDGANSTGIGFVVRVNSQTVWKYDTAQTVWKPGTVDLTPWRGQPVLIELISDSAGQNSYDWARWAGLTIAQ